MALMATWVESHKPGAAARTHLLLAGLMWSAVGTGLLSFGVSWSWHGHTALTPWSLAAAVAIGLLKSRLIMDNAARRIIGRIRARGDGRCLGGFVSLPTWLLIAAMMGLGRLLRTHFVAPHVVGVIYVAVGSALLVSSRLMWRAWRHPHPDDAGPVRPAGP